MNNTLFERICSIENIFAAWERFSDGKRSKADVMAFELYLEDNLFSLRNILFSGEYRHDTYKPFTIFDPKQRRIHKATVKDRVVHQAIVNVIEPFFENRFIHDSYSCRVGKGTHAAVDRLRIFIRQASCNNTRTVFALKCDVRKFFASVNHDTLLSLLARQIDDPRTMELLENIIGSFSVGNRQGIPLGNLTSQLFANIYLHELDRYVKINCRERYYLRYCDDFIILSESRERLSGVTRGIEEFLNARLSLQLHPKKVFIRTWTQGIDFLGYVLFPHATVIRLNTVEWMLWHANEDNINSYLGVCSHANAFELEQIVLTKSISLGLS
ncbi:group II intron reverse transcriptase domain-containing protein [Patescibacteria group bacterium]|nr:group II intron reverse transcriptase domain-containing protein [Patescibacteria group bacterium]